MKEFLIGDTVRVSWANSGGTNASDVYVKVVNEADAVVSSETMTNSSTGLYGALITLPNTPGFYVVWTEATLGGKAYRRRKIVRTVEGLV